MPWYISICAVFLVFRHGYVDVERESSMVRWRGYPSIQRDQLELLTMSGDGEIQKKLRREITTVTSLSWLALFLINNKLTTEDFTNGVKIFKLINSLINRLIFSGES